MNAHEPGLPSHDSIRFATGRHIMAFLTCAAILLGISLFSYWTIKQNYFPDLSPFSSHLNIMALTFLIFSSAHLLFIRYLRTTLLNEITTLQSKKISSLETSLSLFEKRLTETKTENKLLVSKLEEGKNTSDINIEKLIRKETPNLIMHERVFVHELANKIQIANTVVSELLDSYEASNEKQNDHLVKQLKVADKNLKAMSNLIKENRDYLIIAS